MVERRKTFSTPYYGRFVRRSTAVAKKGNVGIFRQGNRILQPKSKGAADWPSRHGYGANRALNLSTISFHFVADVTSSARLWTGF
jgi:hypothetical protein